MMRCAVVLLFVGVCYCQSVPNVTVDTSLHTGLTERIGNFSVELLYHTSRSLPDGGNFIMSPITVWSVLAVISEGASGDTRKQINRALRMPPRNTNITKAGFRNISQWLQVVTDTVQLAKISTLFVDKKRLPLPDFIKDIKTYYDTELIALDFADSVNTANLLNNAVSNFTHGTIPKIVEPSYFSEPQMVLTSALYFKGQWSVPFNTSSTSQMPFHDTNGKKIGDVNMMYNRHTYPFSNFKYLQARVIELPYGKEDRLSMLIMLPNPGVSVENMFENFRDVNLDQFFAELRQSKEEYADDEVDCYIPRFKIESDIELTNILKSGMGIYDLFDADKSLLPHMAREPLHVTRVVHKAKIEVTEEGTTAAAVTAAEFSNRIGVVQFLANRPFSYVIVEKVTNSIVFAGFYKQPSLY